ncbi:MAG: hypothetical protein ACRD2E_00885 [Terriglobales bacterium]
MARDPTNDAARPRTRVTREDLRGWDQRLRDGHTVGLYIGVLCTELIIWALLAWAVVGNRTITRFKYYLPDTVPASYPYNGVMHFHRQQRQ